jgi:hypothetical protein
MRHRVYRREDHIRARSAYFPAARLQAPKSDWCPISEAVVDFVLFGSPQEFRISHRGRFFPCRDSNQQLRAQGIGHPIKNAERSARDGARRVLR